MKKYPSVFIAIFLILGIILNYFIKFPLFFLILLSLTGIIFFIVKKYELNIIGITLILISISVLNFQNSTTKFNYDLNNKFFNITADIKNIKYGENNNTVTVTNVFIDNIENPSDMLVYIKDKNTEYRIGDKIKLSTKVYIPRNNSNPGEFNYYNYMLSNDVYAYSYVDNVSVIGRSDNSILKLRNSFYDIVNKGTSNLEHNAKDFVFSVITGNNVLSKEYDEIYTNLGILHIISVSGFHIVLMESFMLLLLGIININRNLKRIFVLILIFIYCLIIDFPPSALRAFIFLLTALISSIFNLPKINIKTLSIAAIILLLINPTNILDIGFQFSFLATLGIILIFPILVKKHKKEFNILDALLLTIIINILLFPLQVFYFNKVQIASLLGNLIAIPLLTCIIYMSVFLIIFTKIHIINFLLSKMISMIYLLETYLIRGIDNLFKTSKLSFNLEDIICIYLVIFLLIFVYYFRNKIKNNSNQVKKVIFLFIPIYLLYSVFPFNDNSMLQITAINVGQGDSFLLKSKNYNILFDTGGSFRADNSFNKLEKYLNYEKINRIDAVFLSHFDEDHAGNIEKLIEKYGEFPIYSRIDGKNKFTEKYKVDKNLYRDISEGENVLGFDGIKMSFLNTDGKSEDENENSVIILLAIHDNKILFTGDITKNIEDKVIREDLNSNIIKIPHHGSKTSSSDEFIKKVNPSIAILTVGENNSYNLPNKEVLKRYEENNIKIFRTDYDGAIFMFFDHDGVNIYTKKNIFSKYIFSIEVYCNLLLSTLILAIIYYVGRYDYEKIE